MERTGKEAEPAQAPGAETPPSRSERKRAAIVSAAEALFLEGGYRGTSVDQIAARAGVSKQTVYKHFGDKERLFTAIVVETTRRAGAAFFDQVSRSRDVASVQAGLERLATVLVHTVMEPPVLRLRRLVVAEAVRFPELGRLYFEEGPRRGIDALEALFTDYTARGLLRMDDPRSAAEHFTWLVVSTPLNAAMLLGEDARPTRSEWERHAVAAVGVFLGAYGPAGR